MADHRNVTINKDIQQKYIIHTYVLVILIAVGIPKNKKDTNKYSKNSDYAPRLPGPKRQIAVSVVLFLIRFIIVRLLGNIYIYPIVIYISVLQQLVK